MSAPRVDHIGIVVDDLDAAIAAVARMLPGAPLTRRTIADAGLEVAEFAAANVIVELLHYSDDGTGFARAVMGSAPGVNHLSLSVENLDAALQTLRAGGVEPTAGFPRRGAHGRIAFLPREPHTGLLFELCEPNATDHATDRSDDREAQRAERGKRGSTK